MPILPSAAYSYKHLILLEGFPRGNWQQEGLLLADSPAGRISITCSV
jgi:hypothetical protein